MRISQPYYRESMVGPSEYNVTQTINKRVMKQSDVINQLTLWVKSKPRCVIYLVCVISSSIAL